MVVVMVSGVESLFGHAMFFFVFSLCFITCHPLVQKVRAAAAEALGVLGAGRIGASGEWLFKDELVTDSAVGGAAMEAGSGAACRQALFEALPSLPEARVHFFLLFFLLFLKLLQRPS